LIVEKPSRTLALLTYLIPVIAPLYVIFTRPKDIFARYHAYQSLALIAGVILVPAVWAVGGWIIAWVPLVGPLLAASAFAIVMAAFAAFLYGWVMGIVAAWRAEYRRVPLVGAWGERLLR
jgi:uncharacterized membrane protein